MAELPGKADVYLEGPVRLSAGLVGLVEACAVGIEQALDDAAPYAIDELLTISGVGFANYVYDPEYNRFEPPYLQYSPLGEYVCNWGAFEALNYYTGLDIKEFNGISREDFWKLVRFELASGRPVPSLRIDPAPRPVLLTGYTDDGRREEIRFVGAGHHAVESVEVTGFRWFQGDSETFRNWGVIVRERDVPPQFVSTISRQRGQVIRWAAQHAGRIKEFSHETRENYAPGLRGHAAFGELLERVADDAAEVAGELPEAVLRAYLVEHVEHQARGRAAVARTLPAWAADTDDDARLVPADAVEVAELLGEAAETYAAVAATHAEGLEAIAEGDVLDARYARELRDGYLAAAEQEAGAAEALAGVVQALNLGL